MEVYQQANIVTCFLRLDPDSVSLEKGFTRDVRKIGRLGTDDLEVMIRSFDDFTNAQPLFQRAYEGG